MSCRVVWYSAVVEYEVSALVRRRISDRKARQSYRTMQARWRPRGRQRMQQSQAAVVVVVVARHQHRVVAAVQSAS